MWHRETPPQHSLCGPQHAQVSDSAPLLRCSLLQHCLMLPVSVPHRRPPHHYQARQCCMRQLLLLLLVQPSANGIGRAQAPLSSSTETVDDDAFRHSPRRAKLRQLLDPLRRDKNRTTDQQMRPASLRPLRQRKALLQWTQQQLNLPLQHCLKQVLEPRQEMQSAKVARSSGSLHGFEESALMTTSTRFRHRICQMTMMSWPFCSVVGSHAERLTAEIASLASVSKVVPPLHRPPQISNVVLRVPQFRGEVPFPSTRKLLHLLQTAIAAEVA
mmetsp:Transcript_41838/g.98062  ORF Transcript_41838/g.98062 Transcript_41838/m.98062 type:complete len:272 (+) Transcript_41838:119-934(+)